ncbi:preprotein translocase subunit YajC [Gulosibacter chungangensis]|uniref:Preprotein translocase subunit YajC n=1 Tax=Gulosibacter chungangensis TaxID=979746 RepID=A0A7J5BEH8_9MICO|nr:preprotein translocase subunit YajC [Gulosibacter chungangensis]KAB1644054.1 preprotein translocase subunit YajC [Gulosibacter chungangensis]
MDLTLLLPLALLVLMMVFMWRSNKKRTAQQQELRAKIQPGVEVMTQSGIFGTLISVDEDSNVATVETSPGVVLRVHKATIANVVEPAVEVPNDASALTGDAVEDSTIADSKDVDTNATDAHESNADDDNSNEDRPKA